MWESTQRYGVTARPAAAGESAEGYATGILSRFRAIISRTAMGQARITWVRGPKQIGPEEMIGVLEVNPDGGARAVFAERTEVDGRCHIRLARQVWSGKDSLETRWWSLVLDGNCKVYTVRTGSCGDLLLTTDVPRVIRALEELDLHSPDTMLALDDGCSLMPWRPGRPA